MKTEAYKDKNLTAAEISLCRVYERREKVYQKAEEKRRKELQLVNESIASMISPAVVVPVEEEKSAATNDMMAEEQEEEIATAQVIEHDPEKYKDFSKQAAMASEQLKEKLSAKSQAKRKYDITAGPNDKAAQQDKTGKDGTAKRLKKKAATAEENQEDMNIVDTEKVTTMLDPANYITQEPWDPKTATESITFSLEKYGVNDEDEEAADEDVEEEDTLLKYAQTVVLQLSVPPRARRWSLNICPADHKNLSDVFLHVNPRYNKGKLHLNDKQGTWGRPQEVPMKHQKSSKKGTRGDGLLSRDVELVISITKKAFCIYANGVCAAIFPHRRDLRKHQQLSLVLGRSDDNGVLEDAVFHTVWWGYLSPRVNHHKLMTKDQKEYIATLLTFDGRQEEREKQKLQDAATAAEDGTGGVVQEEPSERTLEINGLPPHTDPKEIQHIEEALYGAFEEYSPEDVQIAAGAGRGYARFPSLDLCLEALQSMQGVGIEAEGACYSLELKRLEHFA